MIYVSQVWMVDGIRTQLTARVVPTAGCAVNALEMLKAAATELGGTPEATIGVVAAQPAPASAEAPKRTRRTKAEIEAEAAAAAAAAQPPMLPPGVGAPGAPITQAFAPASVELSGVPMMPPAPHENVTLAPPPFAAPSHGAPSMAPPPFAPPPIVESPEDTARFEVKNAIADLIGSVPANWADSVRAQVQQILSPLAGGNIDAMSVAEAKSAEAGVLAYRQKCMAALGQ